MNLQKKLDRLFTLLQSTESKGTLNEDGTILIVAMLLIAILSLIGISAGKNVITDTAIASNYLASIQSFYVAEAGAERGKNECAARYLAGGWSNFNQILRGADGTAGTSDDGILTFGNSVNFHGGTHAVKVVNDYGDTGGASSDTNNTVTIVSTGTFGGATATVRTTIKMNTVPPLPGAINLVGGYATRFNGAGSAFNVDGRDYRISDADNNPTGTNPALQGISVNDVPDLAAGVAAIDSTITSQQAGNIQGAGGSPSVGSSTLMSKTILREFSDSMKMSADTLLVNPPDVSGSTDSNNCVMIGTQNTCMGTLAAPKLTYISVTDGNAFTISGDIAGVGILILDGNSLVFRGDVNWTGVVIVLGQNIAFDNLGGGHTQNVRGGLLVGEYADTNTSLDLDIRGNPKLTYSQEALNLVSNYLVNKKKYSVISWQRTY
jgi:Tfp pilus assembly protein PilX